MPKSYWKRSRGVRHYGLFVATLLFLSSACAQPADVPRSANVIQLSGLQLQACAAAFEEFKKRGFVLEQYKVFVTEDGSSYEVDFVPNHPEGKPTTRGGKTIYGKEIRYTVSRSGVIENIGYSR